VLGFLVPHCRSAPTFGLWTCARLFTTILERVRRLLMLALEEPFLLFFLRELMPAFGRDNAQLVLPGLLVFGDKPASEKVGAEEHKCVARTLWPLFIQG
jgi:hypothetical protein